MFRKWQTADVFLADVGTDSNTKAMVVINDSRREKHKQQTDDKYDKYENSAVSCPAYIILA